MNDGSQNDDASQKSKQKRNSKDIIMMELLSAQDRVQIAQLENCLFMTILSGGFAE
jgi:hypothetical protein